MSLRSAGTLQGVSAVAYDGRRLGAGIADGGAGVDLEFARAMKEAAN
jgi:hypothetical protein